MGLFDSLFGNPNKDAANQNRALYGNLQDLGTQYLQQGYNTGVTNVNNALGSFNQLGDLAKKYGGSVDTLNNALGVNGAGGAQAGADAFKNSIYSTVSGKAGLDAINRRRAAAGMLDSGNADQDAQTFQTNLVNGQIGNWLGNLGGMSNNALSATAGTASGQAGAYNDLSSLAQNNAMNQTGLLNNTVAGQTSANNLEAQGEAAGARNLLGLVSGALSLGTGGGGGTVGGSLLNSLFKR